jgi:hypothetical protein
MMGKKKDTKELKLPEPGSGVDIFPGMFSDGMEERKTPSLAEVRSILELDDKLVEHNKGTSKQKEFLRE